MIASASFVIAGCASNVQLAEDTLERVRVMEARLIEQEEVIVEMGGAVAEASVRLKRARELIAHARSLFARMRDEQRVRSAP